MTRAPRPLLRTNCTAQTKLQGRFDSLLQWRPDSKRTSIGGGWVLKNLFGILQESQQTFAVELLQLWE